MSRLSDDDLLLVLPQFWAYEAEHTVHTYSNPFVGSVIIRYCAYGADGIGGYRVHVAAIITAREVDWSVYASRKKSDVRDWLSPWCNPAWVMR